MPSFTVILALLIPFLSLFYQYTLKSFIFTTVGVGRIIQQPSDFNAVCMKIEGHDLEGCEDMWLDNPSGLLYMACSNSLGRTAWLPSIDHYNASGRTKTDRFVILDTRSSGPIASRLTNVKPVSFNGNNGDSVLDLHGFDVRISAATSPPVLQMLVINHRPPLDPITGALLDATKVGANSTVELFETVLGSSEMTWKRTWWEPDVIHTPNNVAWVEGGKGFVFTNDRSGKTGFRRSLDIPFGGGSVGYCAASSSSSACVLSPPSTTGKLSYPNGLIALHSTASPSSELIFVPSSVTGEIYIMRLDPATHILTRIQTLQADYPMDNLNVDAKGDIYAAAFPRTLEFAASAKDPWGLKPDTTGLRVRKVAEGEDGGKWVFEKVVEARKGDLPAATVLVHDAKTGRLFFGTAWSPYIGICETRL